MIERDQIKSTVHRPQSTADTASLRRPGLAGKFESESPEPAFTVDRGQWTVDSNDKF